jgi:DHA1 family bicyclomycin/chloramphenicol resistance-like MFS transporter
VSDRWRHSQPAPDSVRLFVLLGVLAGAGPAALDMYVPALPRVASDLQVSTSAAQLTIAFYLAGLALGQLLFGQLSDVFGRRRPVLVGLLLFTVASALCFATSSLAALCAARLVQGAAGASGMAIGRSVVRDLYGTRASARYYSRLTIVYGVAPIVAPIVGSQVLRFTSWHGIFAVICGLGLLILIAVALWFPETLPRELRRPGTIAATRATFGTLRRDRRFLGCTLTLGMAMGALVAYVATATFVIQDGYGASTQMFAALFGANAFVMVAGNQLNAHLLRRFTPSALAVVGLGLLLLGSAGAIVVAVGGLSLAVLEICLACMLGSYGFVQGNVLAIGLAEHAKAAGAASALFGLIQYATGAVIAPLAGLGARGSVAPLAAVSFTCALIAAASAYFLVLRGRPVTAVMATPPVELV